ncbi:uncharacterized protein LOC122507481 [Leptopilina heterotoma]|uniref:uncharacterized protein LOC122507481 n=1 Tax=Leptopilina heterotoma TaxID=63436 RepID=UPI001CAA3AD6|nr:uncharacterized protein LOC122507481 [Leptopilina heterotoma]XP_043476148.1 uncharacterized protein LOC122507481 [Leptopilina heterotoma]XP_043476149.1 uncharacterized protein LOC122507481 [Leptopilina heterotoma]
MKSSRMERFLPNECYICKSRDNLKRCECNMISYCSEDHRLQHLLVHESFCKVIKELLKEKKVSHIYEELIDIYGDPWGTKENEIYREIKKKLERNLSPLENFMFDRPRNCFVCSNTQDEDLINCPHCPVASFCKKHPRDELHSKNCKVMNQYLNILNTAEELNIDLEFLSPTFPCITEEKVNQTDIDELTLTYRVEDMNETCLQLRLLKLELISFMDVASKINNAFQKIHNTISEGLLIHIDAFSYEHAITKKNYWEFLLHLNPQIKMLKIVITATKNLGNLETFLCQNCHSEGKNLNLEILSKSYDDYMLDENYQKPDILFYVQINDECNSERLNKWSEFNCPIILRFDSKLNFFKVHHFLSLLKAKFRFIFAGKIKAAFGILSSIENEDYFIILQSMENKVHENCCDKITATITHQCGENSSANGIEDASKVTPPDLIYTSDNNENSKLESNENQSTSTSYTDSNMIVIEKENINTNESEEEKTCNNEKMEVKESNKEEKSVDRVALSPSSSKRSFASISEPGEEEEGEKNKKAKTESCKNISKSIDKENFDPNGEEGKNTKENKKEKKNIEKRNEKEDKHKKFLVDSESFESNETVSYLKNENEGLRQTLNLALKETTKLKTKFDQVCFELNKKEKVIKNLLRVIVNFEDTDSMCEENKI